MSAPSKKTTKMIKEVETHHNTGDLQIYISDSPYDPCEMDTITISAADFIKLIKMEVKNGNSIVDNSIQGVYCKAGMYHCLHLGFKNVIKFNTSLKVRMKEDAYKYGRGLIIILNKYSRRDINKDKELPVDNNPFYKEPDTGRYI